MARASFLIEATAREGRMLVNPAAHVDGVDPPIRRGGTTPPTIALTTLRVANRIHKPAAAIFAGRSTSKNRVSEEFTFQR